ncbi:MAG: peptide chain release factor H [Hyphomicrobiaceae bacterium]
MIRLLLTSGRGPAECRIALAKARAALVAEAEAAGLDVDSLEGPSLDGHGPASVVLVLHGEGAADLARPWIGTLQWVAPSPVRAGHKRKNWFVGVVDLGAPPEAPRPLETRDVRLEAMRAGGPGGQHQNKTESAVRAVHVPTGLAVVAREERSQARNKALALGRLAALVRLGAELDAIADRQRTQAAHDALERGRPVKRFRGLGFTEERGSPRGRT